MIELAPLFTKYKIRILSVGIALLTLIVVANLFGSQGRRKEMLLANKETELKRNEVLASISKLEKKIASYKKVFNKRDASAVINTISNIAKESNVKIISMKPRQEENFPAYIRYPFELVIGVDSYHVIAKFISKIENYPEMFFIDRFEIKLTTANKEDTQQGQGHKLLVGLTISTVALKN